MSVLKLYFIHTLQFIFFFQQRMLHHLNKFFIIFCPFEEFKGTGNMELVLDRKLAEKRIFPAINIQRSGTRREDLLLSKEEQEIVYALHREMSGNRAEENMEQILNFFKRTKNNKEFIQVMKHSLLKK